MLDWNVPLRTRNGFPATVLHEYYNGVQQMVVVSLNRGPTCKTPDAKDVEIIKVYDKQCGMDQTHQRRASWAERSDWDLEVMPPPDKIRFLPIIDAERSPHVYDVKQNFRSGSIVGQIKFVIDGRTGKIKSAEIV